MLFASMFPDIKFVKTMFNEVVAVPESGAEAGGFAYGSETSWVGGVPSSHNLWLRGITETRTEKYTKKLSASDVMDTAENPVLLVLCSEIQLYKGIMADFKVQQLRDGMMLFALISGACIINGVPLQRCDKSVLDEKTPGRKMGTQDLFGATSPLGKRVVHSPVSKKDYILNYTDYSILHARITESDEGLSIRNVKDYEVIIHQSVYDAKLSEIYKKIDEEKRAHEAMLEKKKQEVEEYTRLQKEKAVREFERMEAEAEARRSGLKVGKDEVVVNVGAAAFLQAVAANTKK